MRNRRSSAKLEAMLQVSMTATMHDGVFAEAERTDDTASNVVRRAIRQYLADQNKKED